MALVVNTNIPSIAAQRYLMESRNEMETAMERLSSGKRINSAADDAAGLAISTRMDSQIRGINMAIKNANDGISMVQTAEGALQEVTDMLQRMRELALQSVHGSNNDDDRAAMDAEVQQLKAEIDRVSESTSFNAQNILDGTFNRLFQIGDQAGDTIRIGMGSVDTASLGMAATAEASSDVADMLVSARLASTFSWDPVDSTLAGTTASEVTGISFAAGDITINGQELAAFDGTSEDIYDLVTNINENVDNVSASAFNTVVAKTVGTGIVRENQVAIEIGAIGTSTDPWYQAEKIVVLERSDSMEEMVANINAAFYDNEVVATINDDGKLVLSNDTGATIKLADISGTDGAYDGATGFEVQTVAGSGSTTVAITATGATFYGTGVQGFLKLSSTDESPIEIEAGNLGLTAPGAISDIQAIGFNMTEEDPTGNSYTVTGTRLVDTSVAATLGKHTTTEQADLTLNGVEIYDATLSAASNTFQGKLDLINAFSDESGVVASAYYEKTFNTANWTLVKGDTFDLNGTTITVSATVASTVTAINNATANTGITAEADGSNVILKGDGVQNVTFVQNDYTVSTNNNQAESRRSADTADQTQRISFASTDIVAGRVLTLKFDTTNATDPDGTGNAVAGLSIAANSSLTLGYTVQSGDSAGDVATAFHDLILNKIHDSVPTIAVSEGQYVDLTVATSSLVFLSAFDLGEATITIGVSQTATASRIFYDASADGGATANYTDHAAIRLQSTDLNPISIEFAETGNEIGLLENNVGDTTWDANSATFQTTGQAGVAVSGLSVSTSEGANEALDVLNTAIQDISDMRSNLGAIENRLGHTVSNLSNVVENTSAAQSRIQDADFALEAAALARAQILQQAGTAMLAQANAAPQSVLSLLG